MAWAPLPFASVGRGAEAALIAAVCLALALAALGLGDRRDLAPAAPALALLGLAALGLAQSLPLPASWVAALSPEHVRLGAEAAAALGGEAAAATLSLAPAISRWTALTFAGVAAAFAAATLAGRRRRHRRWLAGAVAASALFGVLYGLRRLLAGSSSLWGVELPGASDRLRGTFVNPNHFALSLEIALAVVFAWGWAAARRARYHDAVERKLLLVAPPVVVWLGLFAALALTRSRAGLAAAAAAVAAQGLMVAAAGRRWRLAPVGLAAAVAGLGLAAAVGLQHGLGRLLATSPYEVAWGERAQVYRLTFGLWRDFPWTGSGLGTFYDAFPAVQTAALPETWVHAHCDPLELLLTGGVIAVVIAVWGLSLLAVRLGRLLVAGVRSEHRAAALGALGALTAAAVHEGLDFGLTAPANGFTLAVVCGAAAGVRLPRRRRRREGAPDPEPPLRIRTTSG